MFFSFAIWAKLATARLFIASESLGSDSALSTAVYAAQFIMILILLRSINALTSSWAVMFKSETSVNKKL